MLESEMFIQVKVRKSSNPFLFKNLDLSYLLKLKNMNLFSGEGYTLGV